MKIKHSLALLFAAVIAAGAAMTIVLVRRSAESAFRGLALSGDSSEAEAYALLLAEYRAEKGDWAGAQEFLGSLPGVLSGLVDARMRELTGLSSPSADSARTMQALLSDRVVVADEGGRIVADSSGLAQGSVHPERHLKHGYPISLRGIKVGTVLVGSMVDSSLSGAEERFLNSLLAAIAWSVAAATGVALPLGVLFASRITRPIQRLAGAAGKLASGDRADPLPEGGSDEIAALSRAFNEMGAELARLDEAKRRLIADSAHELRTPTTLIRGMVEGMLDGVLPADRPTLESVHEETRRLSRLIDRLRELEIIESGELELSLGPVDLVEALDKAVLTFRPAAREKSIELDRAPVEGAIEDARGDGLRIGEVVYNLMENAIKYTPPGGRIRLSASGAEKGSVGFVVEDSGPGIPAAERERVFERFYRLDGSRSSRSGGRGLGLAICAEIVKAHGGKIVADASELGGARFTVTLPAHRPVDPAREEGNGLRPRSPS